MLSKFRNRNRTPEKNTKAPATREAVIDTLEDRRLMAVAGGAIGINVNDSSSSFMNKAVPVMKKLGVTTVRLWLTADFNSRWKSDVLQRAKDYSNKGFDVMMIVQPKDGKVYSQTAVKDWFKWALSDNDLKKAVDRWEIGNEPDKKDYWKGSVKSYVTDLLKPASEVLRSHGEKVVSAGPSWDSRDVQTMIDAGMLNYVDFVGYHPYAKGVSLVKQRINEINAVVKGRKPIVASEWNVRGYESGSKTDWANAVKDVYSSIKGGFAYNYYFCLKVQNSMAGPAGILKADGSPNTLFYNAFATFSGQGATAPSTGSTPSGNNSSGNNSSTSGASISGKLWNDTDGDGVWDSNESNTDSGRKVFIDSDGDGQLDSNEKSTTSASDGSFKFTGLTAGTYKISRVFPSGYRLSNASGAKYITVTISANEQKTGVNIGSTDKKPGSTSSGGSSSSSGGSSSTKKASISGKLWNDSDGDGKWDSNETATGSGRQVFIDKNGNGKLDSGEVSTISDANGFYKFDGLDAGTYKISRVFPNGHALSNGSKYLTVTVTAGEEKRDVNIGSKYA